MSTLGRCQALAGMGGTPARPTRFTCPQERKPLEAGCLAPLLAGLLTGPTPSTVSVVGVFIVLYIATWPGPKAHVSHIQEIRQRRDTGTPHHITATACADAAAGSHWKLTSCLIFLQLLFLWV